MPPGNATLSRGVSNDRRLPTFSENELLSLTIVPPRFPS